MMIFEYQCQECGTEQERLYGDTEERVNTKPCEKCNAPPEKQKRILSGQRCRHKSWGLWAV